MLQHNVLYVALYIYRIIRLILVQCPRFKLR